ncbi:MAG TPA: dihydrodipicolinate synthase family protein [Vicinamibacterales bacterium]|nr:dihydrodipicolinate synthase family protein [Vicinamibacterales bacterium]
MKIHGVLPPIPTPFDASDEVDFDALRFDIERWMTTPLAGIVALGSNGEAALIDEDESERIVATVRERVPRDRLLIAGTGRESTKAAVAAARRAARAGADAVLVRTPSFFKSQMTMDALIRHYTAVADASPVPVILYNFTAVTGVNLLPVTVARLAEHPNIVGVKESGGDMAQVGDLVSLTPPDFSVLVGAAPTLYTSLCLGASGGIVAAACVIPEECVRLYELTGAGRHAEALALQRQITPLARSVTSGFGVPGLKAALNLAGYRAGQPRPPLQPVPPPALDTLREQLRAFHEVALSS